MRNFTPVNHKMTRSHDACDITHSQSVPFKNLPQSITSTYELHAVFRLPLSYSHHSMQKDIPNVKYIIQLHSLLTTLHCPPSLPHLHKHTPHLLHSLPLHQSAPSSAFPWRILDAVLRHPSLICFPFHTSVFPFVFGFGAGFGREAWLQFAFVEINGAFVDNWRLDLRLELGAEGISWRILEGARGERTRGRLGWREEIIMSEDVDGAGVEVMVLKVKGLIMDISFGLV